MVADSMITPIGRNTNGTITAYVKMAHHSTNCMRGYFRHLHIYSRLSQ